MYYNLILNSDSYKVSHWLQYPPGTQHVYSYLEARGGVFPETMLVGLQALILRYLIPGIVSKYEIELAAEIIEKHLGPNVFNSAGWNRLYEKHNGVLPIHIKAVPEGLPIPIGNVLMTVENTDPEFYWLTNYLETLLVQVWYPSTVATQSWYIKKSILKFLEQTGTPDLIDFKLHDFGFRGVSSVESAALGGLAHLVNFKGTDTMVALLAAYDYYLDFDKSKEMPGFSIPAAEHSTICSWGRENEVDAFRNMLESYPTGFVACVSDSYDIFKACTDLWGGILKDAVLARDGVLVVRPDSGRLPDTILEVLNRLGNAFGTEVNSKGFKVLNPKVRVIQGDGVDRLSIVEILTAMMNQRWSADNIAFGMGGALLQKLNRDTCSYAFKCSNVTINGQDREVFKAPVTDPLKYSKKGRLKLVSVEGAHGKSYRTINQGVGFESDILVDVFKDGQLLKKYTFNEVRENTKKSINYWG